MTPEQAKTRSLALTALLTKARTLAPRYSSALELARVVGGCVDPFDPAASGFVLSQRSEGIFTHDGNYSPGADEVLAIAARAIQLEEE